MRFTAFFILLAFFWVEAMASSDTITVDNHEQIDSTFIGSMAGLGDHVLNWVTWEYPRYTFAVIPAVAYNPRTQFEFGVMPVWRFKPRYASDDGFYRPATITQNIQVSTSGMFELGLDYMAFTRKGLYISIDNQLLYLPDRYYGIGNETKNGSLFVFNSAKYQLKGSLLKAVTTKFFAGIDFDFAYTRNSQADSVFFDSSLSGATGGWTNCMGPSVVFDSRNNTLYPSKGCYVRLSTIFAGNALASDYQYSWTTFDGRYFLGLGVNMDHIIAFQALWSQSGGDVPFYKLPALGGKSAVRGIGHPNRYIDNGMWMVQTEYRKYIWWRVGFAAFAGVGNVYHQSPDFFQMSHPFCGVGARFMAISKEKLNFRIDYGRASRGDDGIFFTIREAF